METQRAALGLRIRKARLARRWGKEQAAREAGISSITWKRVEDGFGVQEHKLAAVMGSLGPDESGEPLPGVLSHVAEAEWAKLSESTRGYILDVLRADMGSASGPGSGAQA